MSLHASHAECDTGDGSAFDDSLAMLIDHLPGMVYRCAPGPRRAFSLVSAGCLELTGWSSADLLEGRVAFEELIAEADRAAVEAEVRAALAARASYRVDYRIRARDGGERWVRETGRWVLDERGEVLALEGLVQDAGERHALEERLRAAARLEAVGRLAGGVAHDFNNVLTTVLGYADMLASQLVDGSPAQRQAARILQAARHGEELTRRLLYFTRTQPAAPRRFDLSELVLQIDPLLRRLVGEDVELVSHLAHEAAPVLADPGLIEQVLVHLAVEARQCLPAGGRLTIEVRLASDDGPHAVVVLSDRSTSASARPAAPSAATAPELAICSEIVERAGGRLDLEGPGPDGLRWRLRLPIAAASEARPESPPAHEPARGGGETVLLVEDEPLVRQVALEALEARGFQVLVARSGGEALEIARRVGARIDVLVTDLVLPLMSGGEVARRVRELQPRVRVLHVSGYGGPLQGLPGGRTPGGPLASDAFLPKPFTARALAGAVRELLGDERREARDSG